LTNPEIVLTANAIVFFFFSPLNPYILKK